MAAPSPPPAAALNKTAAATAQSARRNHFLQSAAHALATTAPTIARHLLYHSINDRLETSIRQHVCRMCCTVLVPAATATVRPRSLTANGGGRTAVVMHVCHCCGHANTVNGSRRRRGRGGRDPRSLSQSIATIIRPTTTPPLLATMGDSRSVRAEQRQKSQTIKKLQSQQANTSTKHSHPATTTATIANSGGAGDRSSNPFAGSLFFKFQHRQKTELNQLIDQQAQSSSPTGSQPFSFAHPGEKRASPPPSSMTLLEQAAKKRKLEVKAEKTKSVALTLASASAPVLPLSSVAGGSLYNLMQEFARR